MNECDLTVDEHVELGGLTTFKIGGPARYFTTVTEAAQVPQAIAFAREKDIPFFILGGGSNVVVSDKGYHGLVIKMANRGIHLLEETRDAVTVRVAAGEDWDYFAAYCVSNGWWGVENMSLIPGTVGALPIQNVGAYGQEAKDTITSVEVWDTQTRTFRSFTNEACGFSYRSSIFNGTAAGRYVITLVSFRFLRQGRPNITHGAVREYLRNHPDPDETGKPEHTLSRMRSAIIALRTDGRLPDPRRIGNAGSFFKNVLMNEHEFMRLRQRVREEFDEEASRRIELTGKKFHGPQGYKIPAVDLIRLCRLTHAAYGGAEVYSANPIVLINKNGKATANEIMKLADEIRSVIYERTGIILEIEPKPVGFLSCETT